MLNPYYRINFKGSNNANSSLSLKNNIFTLKYLHGRFNLTYVKWMPWELKAWSNLEEKFQILVSEVVSESIFLSVNLP